MRSSYVDSEFLRPGPEPAPLKMHFSFEAQLSHPRVFPGPNWSADEKSNPHQELKLLVIQSIASLQNHLIFADH